MSLVIWPSSLTAVTDFKAHVNIVRFYQGFTLPYNKPIPAVNLEMETFQECTADVAKLLFESVNGYLTNNNYRKGVFRVTKLTDFGSDRFCLFGRKLSGSDANLRSRCVLNANLKYML